MRTPILGTGLRACSLLLTALLVGAGCDGGGESGGGEVTDTTPPAQRGTYLNIVAPSVIQLGEETTVRVRVITQAGLATGPVELPRWSCNSPWFIWPSS